MDDTTYNGWTNYETWATALWLDNDAPTCAFWHDMAQECWEAAAASQQVGQHGLTRKEFARLELMTRLKEAVHEQCPDLGACLFADLLSAALSEVDWWELANHYLTDCQGEHGQITPNESIGGERHE
jgi:hypothetical protein